MTRVPSVLHVGCGKTPLPDLFQGHTETRFDLDPSCSPDIVGSMTNLGEIGKYDVVYCAHALEHLIWDDALKTLKEFHRVLQPGGKAFVFVPDVEGIVPDHEVLYISSAGPITGMDLFYGAACFIDDNPYMRHQTAFMKQTLEKAFQLAGFKSGAVNRMSNHNLLGIGVK